jgi:hypothetical protein
MRPRFKTIHLKNACLCAIRALRQAIRGAAAQELTAVLHAKWSSISKKVNLVI